MKKLKKYFKVIVLMVMVSMITPTMQPMKGEKVAEAAAIKLSEKSLILNVGQTEKLKLNGTKKAATWTSGDTSIVMVSNNGKVTALKEGRTEITAKLNNKKYVCKVVVLRPENAYVATAPFAAQEKNFGKLSAVIPKDWTCTFDGSEANKISSSIYPTSLETEKYHSSISIYIDNDGTPAEVYSDMKKSISDDHSVEQLQKDFAVEDEKVTASQAVLTDVVTTLGTACKIEFTITYSDGKDDDTYNCCEYYLEFDTYYVHLSVIDLKDNVTPSLKTVSEYFLNSIQINK